MFFGTAIAADRTFNFITIDYPGASYTLPQGISPAGEIAGLYADAAGVAHGFVLRHGVFTTIDYPGAAYTDVRAISPTGDVLGNYSDDRNYLPVAGSAPVSLHGFMRTRHGAVTQLTAYPGHINMIAQRILPDGSVVGCYHDDDYGYWMRGFVLNRGVYTALDGSLYGLDVPMSMNNGATPDLGQITGFFIDMNLGKMRSYVIQNGTKTDFDYPGASRTRAWDMNSSGAIVGDYVCAEERACGKLGVYGFLRKDKLYSSLEFPGASATQARGINPGGYIVGWYQDATGVHGFLAIPMPGGYQ
jgi:uncharacterized membrane protein